MTVEDLVRYFIEASISGASKTQVIREFKKTYNLNENQIIKLENLAKFKKKPKKINYKNFIKTILQKKTQRIYYPFTQIYKQENFLSDEECEELISMISKSSQTIYCC